MGWLDWLWKSAKASYYLWKYGYEFDKIMKEHPDWSFPRCVKALFPDIPKPVAECIVMSFWGNAKKAATPILTQHQQDMYWQAVENMERDLKDMKNNWDQW